MPDLLNMTRAKTPAQIYRDRVKAIKPLLPLSWRDIVFSHNQKYAMGYWRKRLENVFTGKAADVEITELLENIANGKIK